MGTATMIDVAKEAGVSLKTVSRVLNNEVYVTEKTKKAVVEAAKKLNYQLNHAARTLRSGSARIVALLINNPSRSYLDTLHLGAIEKCHEVGMQLLLDDCQNGLDDVRRVVETVSPVGVILTPPLSDDKAVIQYLEGRGIKFVLVAPIDTDIEHHVVTIDDEDATLNVTKQLIARGHKRIGFIKGHPEHGATDKRYNGYLTALEDAGIEVQEELVRQAYFDYASGLVAAEELLSLDNLPTAIFASNDDMAAAVLAAAYAQKIRIPEDLAVVGFDDTQIANIVSPRLTTVRQPIAEMAAAAVALLSKKLSPLGVANRSVEMEYKIVERESAQL